MEEVREAPMAIKGNPIMSNVARLNQTGLNGLSQCGTDGLQTVSSFALKYITCIKAGLYCLYGGLQDNFLGVGSALFLVSSAKRMSCFAGILPSDYPAANQLYD